MKTKKYEIYQYWKDKAITKNFEVKRWELCEEEDEAVKIVDFPDEIVCWGCGILPYHTADSEEIKTLWNQDHLLDRAHITVRSKGGADDPSNLFLLCPNCHEESPDTTNPQNFYAWVYYKRKYDNWAQVYRRELKKAAKIKGIALEELFTHSESINMDLDTIEVMRKKLRERCALHGAAVSMSSKMLSAIDILLEGMENK